MIVARSGMEVPPSTSGLFAGRMNRFAMGLRPFDAMGGVHRNLFEL
jgi:hypothetical protein